MADCWGDSWLASWGGSWGAAAPAPVDEAIDVGGGRVYYQGQRKHKYRKRLGENVRDWVDKLYEDLTAPEMPPAVKQAAAKVVKQNSASKASVPSPASIDWGAVAGEARAVNALLALWEQEVEKQMRAEQERVEMEKKRIRMMIEDEDAVLMSLL